MKLPKLPRTVCNIGEELVLIIHTIVHSEVATLKFYTEGCHYPINGVYVYAKLTLYSLGGYAECLSYSNNTDLLSPLTGDALKDNNAYEQYSSSISGLNCSGNKPVTMCCKINGDF
jgi:hypothetical protein